jgi:trehalose 6-phosphate synthase/phosphatase
MRLVIVSNRLPVTLTNNVTVAEFKRSIGGLVTGIESYLKTIDAGNTCFQDYLWVGWPGAYIKKEDRDVLSSRCISNYQLAPVFLEEEVVQEYYYGFCNKTLWPLFHYFPNYVNYNVRSWECYQKANEAFYSELKKHLKKDDIIWIHDYHLMLLPRLIRADFPEMAISFFLHIPFPTIDMFCHLTKAEQTGILEGILGADVIGFHTYGYARNFLQCVFKILKLPNDKNELVRDGRKIKTDIFPMGIDYQGIQELAGSEKCLAIKQKINTDFTGYKLVLSIDRLDYTKGILNRLIAYDQLLKQYPEWKEKVVLMLIVAPSRREIDSYEQIKKSIDEWVGSINGSYGTTTWVPVIYQYRQFSLLELCALYGASDIALVTPLRDGMNLIAKEFIAAHTDRKGMLVLSEMAGAIHELADSIAVNPNSIEEMVQALITALTMPEETVLLRNERMHSRLKNYDVVKWAHEIITTTLEYKNSKPQGYATLLDEKNTEHIIDQYKKATSRLFLLDYDGTLAPLAGDPAMAKPAYALLKLLQEIAGKEKNEVVIVSGRDRQTLAAWFNGCNISFSADLGAWAGGDGDWRLLKPFDKQWMGVIKPILEKYASKLPLSFVEEKECAFVLDYRMADPELSNLRISELTNEIHFNSGLYAHLDTLRGENSFIVRNTGSNKGDAAAYWLEKDNYDFILAIGDDDVDEELFKALPATAHTIRVGPAKTSAHFYTCRQQAVFNLLQQLL